MSSTAITMELREYALQAVHRDDYMAGLSYDLDRIADRIDAEHERRMSQSRRESRLAAIRYLRGVLLDYEKGIKRVRKGDKAEVVRCHDCAHCEVHLDGSHVCGLTRLDHRADFYCYFGSRRDVDE